MKLQSKTEVDQFDAPLQLEVIGRNGQTHTAIISRLSFSSSAAEGVVQWTGTNEMPASLVRAERGGTPWGQRLSLIAAAASLLCDSGLGPNQWVGATLALPDLLGESGDKVHVRIHRHTWHAELNVDNQPGLSKQEQIPPSLHDLEFGTLLAEMTSRMFLGHSWLVFEMVSTRHAGARSAN